MRRLLGCLCIGLLSLGCQTVKTDKIGKAKVVLLGDSITYGVVSGEPGPPFSQLLQNAFGEQVEFHNIACGGLTAALWQSDAAPAFCQHEGVAPNLFGGRALPKLPADLVVILLGTNDSLLGGGIEPNVYGRQLETLSEALLDHGAHRVMLLAPPFIAASPVTTVRLRGYGKEVKSLCAHREGIVCGPDLFQLLLVSDFSVHDLHPNAAGHAKISGAIEASLRAMPRFKELSPSN